MAQRKIAFNVPQSGEELLKMASETPSKKLVSTIDKILADEKQERMHTYCYLAIEAASKQKGGHNLPLAKLLLKQINENQQYNQAQHLPNCVKNLDWNQVDKSLVRGLVKLLNSPQPAASHALSSVNHLEKKLGRIKFLDIIAK